VIHKKSADGQTIRRSALPIPSSLTIYYLGTRIDFFLSVRIDSKYQLRMSQYPIFRN